MDICHRIYRGRLYIPQIKQDLALIEKLFEKVREKEAWIMYVIADKC